MFYTRDVSRTLFRRTRTHTRLDQSSVVPIPMQVCRKFQVALGMVLNYYTSLHQPNEAITSGLTLVAEANESSVNLSDHYTLPL